MTMIEAPDLYGPITAPAAQPYRFGLFSVLDFADPDVEDGALFGITWESNGCADVGATQDRCLDPDVAPLDASRQCATPQFKPFTVYTFDDASMGGHARSPEAARQAARDRFLLAEQYGVEVGFIAQLQAAVPVPVDLDALTEPSGLFGGVDAAIALLGHVEEQIASSAHTQGVIHMSRFTASVLGPVLRREGNMLVSPLGTPIVAGAGYTDDSVPEALTMYGVGPMVAERGTVDQVSAPNTATNDLSIITQRTYVIGWDCVAVGATISI